MIRFELFFRSTFLCSLGILACTTLVRAQQPTADPWLPAPRAGESIGQAKMTLNGKPFVFDRVVAYETVKYENPTLALRFSYQPIDVQALKASLLKNRGSDDDFGDFIAHLIIYCSPQGKPTSTDFWKDNWSVSVSGAEWTGDLVVKDGRVRGKITLESGDDPAARKNFDVRIDAPIVKLQRSPAVATETKKGAEPSAPEAKKPQAGLAAKSLPVPSDATEIEYKEIVGQITYKSRSDVPTMAAFFNKYLPPQGWKSDDDDLITPASAILSRKLGDAELTIFIKPAAGGSSVSIMTEGLQW